MLTVAIAPTRAPYCTPFTASSLWDVKSGIRPPFRALEVRCATVMGYQGNMSEHGRGFLVACCPVIPCTKSLVTGVTDMPTGVLIMTDIRSSLSLRTLWMSFIDRL